MDTLEMRALYDEDQRKAIEYPDMRRDVQPMVVRHIDTSGGGEGTIVYSRLNETNVDEAIREQVAYFEGIGQDFEWKVYDYDHPADLKDRLGSHGFAVGEDEAIMVLDLEEARTTLWQPVHADVRRILSAERIWDVLTVERQVWDEDFTGLARYLGDSLRNYSEQMSIYVAYANDEPASTAWIYFPKRSQFASLWGGSTVDAFRRQGLYTALLAVRAQEARRRQVRYLTVDARPMSRPILEKYGFEVIGHSFPCRWKSRSRNETVTA